MSGGLPVRVEGLWKVYKKAGRQLQILKGIDLELKPGERVAIVGPSGSGKSTFLHMVGMLDRPTKGRVLLDGLEVSRLRGGRIHRLRNRRVGFVFQSHNLLPDHTALSNVMIPVRLAGAPQAVARQRAYALLKAVGLEQRWMHRPGELSGGEQQRVALARALVNGPGLVLADEPTGNLDPRTAEGVFSLLTDLSEQLGSTLVVVTHSLDLAGRFPRRLRLSEGQFLEDA